MISPFLGLMIDKVGKRALFILSSSFAIVVSCIVTIVLVKQDFQE